MRLSDDKISTRDIHGEPINQSVYFIVMVIRNLILLVTFPFRAIAYILNPFAAKSIKIKKD